MLGKTAPIKYRDQKNPIITVQVSGIDIPNVLVDLGTIIDVITYVIVITLDLWNLKPTPTILELENHSIVGLVGKFEDKTILVDSWQYPVDLLVLHTQSPASENPFILGIPWLVTEDAYIGCQLGNMVISNKEVTSNLILYSPTEPK